MDGSKHGRREAPGVSEFRVHLPETVDARQLLLALGATGLPDSTAPTLAEFVPRYISQYAEANRHKPSGVTSNRSHFFHHLLPLMGETKLDRVTPEQIQALKGKLANHSAKTVNNVLSTLSMTLRVAVKWKVIPRMPVEIEHLPYQAVPVAFYERDEYQRLVMGAQSVGPVSHAVVLLGGDCGLRKGEMIALEWRDIDFTREKIHVQRSETKKKVSAPKGGKSRWVPLTVDAREALKRVPQRATRVLCRDDGAPFIGHRICTPFAQAQRAAGLEADGALHILRHTYCSHLAMAGVPLLAIKEFAGHVSERTTLRYMHLAPGEAGRAMEHLDRWRRQ